MVLGDLGVSPKRCETNDVSTIYSHTTTSTRIHRFRRQTAWEISTKPFSWLILRDCDKQKLDKIEISANKNRENLLLTPMRFSQASICFPSCFQRTSSHYPLFRTLHSMHLCTSPEEANRSDTCTLTKGLKHYVRYDWANSMLVM